MPSIRNALATILAWLRPALSLGTLLGVVVVLLLMTDLGRYLEQNLYLRPLTTARHRLGLSPKVNPELRVVMFEDRALRRLKRHASFDDWRQITTLLAEAGFQRVLLLGFEGVSDAPADQLSKTAAHLFQGVVDTPDAQNVRAIPMASIAPRLIVEARGVAEWLLSSEQIIGPDPGVQAALAGIGLVNSTDELTMPVGRAVGNDRVIPNLGLRAAEHLRWQDGHFETELGPVKSSWNGVLQIELPDHREVLKSAIGASSLFDKEYENVASRLGENAKKALAGGKVAILVPDAYTGTRFIDTPSGRAPSFLGVFGVANAVLSGRFIFAPLPPYLPVCAWSLLLFTLALTRLRRHLDWIALGLFALLVVASVSAFASAGVILPVAQMGVGTLTAAIVGYVARARRQIEERIMLDKDLALGREVQALLFPDATTGSFAGWDYRLVFRPYGPMSGDWHQLYRTSESAENPVCVLAIGDVVGKGPSAALCTAMIASNWHTFSDAWGSGEVDPTAFAASLASTIRRVFRGRENTTLSMVVMTPKSIAFVNYGAPPWIKIDRKLASQTMRSKARNPLGLDDHHTAAGIIRLDAEQCAGETFVAYTDGVLEGETARRGFFKSLQASRSGAAPLSPAEHFNDIEARMIDAGKSSALPDDSTIMMVHRHAPSVSPHQLRESGGAKVANER